MHQQYSVTSHSSTTPGLWCLGPLLAEWLCISSSHLLWWMWLLDTGYCYYNHRYYKLPRKMATRKIWCSLQSLIRQPVLHGVDLPNRTVPPNDFASLDLGVSNTGQPEARSIDQDQHWKIARFLPTLYFYIKIPKVLNSVSKTIGLDPPADHVRGSRGARGSHEQTMLPRPCACSANSAWISSLHKRCYLCMKPWWKAAFGLTSGKPRCRVSGSTSNG